MATSPPACGGLVPPAPREARRREREQSGVPKTYRVACIGCARMGSWYDDLLRERAATDPWALDWLPGSVASVCEAMERMELVACCDLNPELAERMRQRW